MKQRVIELTQYWTDRWMPVDKYFLGMILSMEGYGPNDKGLRSTIDSYLSTLDHFHKMPLVRCPEDPDRQRNRTVATYCYGWKSAQIAKDIKTMMAMRQKSPGCFFMMKDIHEMSCTNYGTSLINKALSK